eukprot:Nk52_evm114s221 gene=Nk52_evmTU114s221
MAMRKRNQPQSLHGGGGDGSDFSEINLNIDDDYDSKYGNKGGSIARREFPDRISSLIPRPVTSRTRRRQGSDASLTLHRMSVNWRYKKIIGGALFAAAILTRFYRISLPHNVVFDEVHFGGMASQYLQRRFFFDVHPPLGKLIFAFAGWIMGYEGEYTFKEIGMDYLRSDVEVPYIAMRSFAAFMNACIVPMTFFSMLEFGFTFWGSLIAGIMVLFENSFVTQSRLILLDSALIFFGACTIFAQARFSNLRRYPFSTSWWKWLAMVGIGLGLTVSVKWVGLFLIALIGIHTIKDLWRLLAETKNDFGEWLLHFWARAVCLILLPVVVYVFIFCIHFSILTISGPGNNFMSQDFRNGLQGVVLSDAKTPIGESASLVLKNEHMDGLLHSHPHLYPVGSKKQQVTTYAFEDHNNWFTLVLKSEGDKKDGLRDGSIINLVHFSTNKGVYCDGFPAPMSGGKVEPQYQEKMNRAKPENADKESNNDAPEEAKEESVNPQYFEVSCDDEDGDEWKVEFISGMKSGMVEKDVSKFRLIREYGDMKCALHSHKVVLPSWGFGQYEVTCNADINADGTVWSVSSLNANKIESYDSLTPAVKDRSGLWYKLVDTINYQKIAWDANSRISSEHVFATRPYQWPILQRGISFYQDNAKMAQIYLLGNPLQYWIVFPVCAIFVLLGIIYTIRGRRGCKDLSSESERKMFLMLDFFILGWALHYFPFFLMNRQLFLHHYFPAHLFAIMFVAGVIDHTMEPFPESQRKYIIIVFGIMFGGSFLYFSPLSYGLQLGQEGTLSRQWLSTWDMAKWENHG